MCYTIGMLEYTDICFNIDRFLEMCSDEHVTLTLATKTIPQDMLMRVHERYPDLIFGENRVQELVDKYFEGPQWIFIGRLQKNKVKYLVDRVQMICSVDSVELAQEIQKRCAKADKLMPVLLELNLGEEQKGGVSKEEIVDLAEAVAQMPNLQMLGVMTVLPIVGADSAAGTANVVYRLLSSKYHFHYLSMGMSGDYEIAIKHGGNMLRIGSAVFGERSYK